MDQHFLQKETQEMEYLLLLKLDMLKRNNQNLILKLGAYLRTLCRKASIKQQWLSHKNYRTKVIEQQWVCLFPKFRVIDKTNPRRKQ